MLNLNVKLYLTKIYMNKFYGSCQGLFQGCRRCCLYIFFQSFSCLFFVLFFFTVIGGKSIYVRLSVSGECYNKDSVWKKLQEEVLL